MKLLQCKVDLSTGYHPQNDGQFEHFHCSIECILRCYIAPDQENWVQVLQNAAFILNSTVYAIYQLSSFCILYEVEPIFPINLAISDLSNNKAQAISDFLQQQQLYFDTIKTSLAWPNAQMAKYAYKHYQDVYLNVGNIV